MHELHCTGLIIGNQDNPEYIFYYGSLARNSFFFVGLAYLPFVVAMLATPLLVIHFQTINKTLTNEVILFYFINVKCT